MQWSSKSVGSRLQHQFFYFLIKCRILFLAKILLAFVVFYYALIPSVGKRARHYLKRRFPNAKGFSLFWQTYKLYKTFANGLFARTVSGILGSFKQCPPGIVEQTIKQTLNKNCGTIILTAHFGVWQLGLAFFEKFDRKINIVQWHENNDVDKHYFEHQGRSPKKIQIINTCLDPDVSLKVVTALNNDELICICGDRATDADQGTLATPFLGGEILLPTTAFLFASMTGKPILLTFTILDGDVVRGVYAEEIHVEPGLRRNQEQLRRYLAHYANVLENLCQKYPYHFFNFYDMWNLNKMISKK